MKILNITAQKPHSTGSGTYMSGLVRSFARAGHKQSVVCGIYPSDSISFPDGVKCCPVYFREDASPLIAFRRGLTYMSDEQSYMCDRPQQIDFPIAGMSDIMPYKSVRYRDMTPDMIREFERSFLITVRRAVSDLDPDLIICHHLFLLTALVRRFFPDRRVYGISHGTDLRQLANCESLRERIIPHISGLDMVFALHENQRHEIIDLFGMDEDRVRTIGSGYDAELFNTAGREEREADDPVRICYAGKISRPKGVPELLSSLDALAADESVPRFELTMAGGCTDETLEDRLARLPSYARWLGQIPQSELACLFKKTDVLVLPSYFEGLPLVLIEAMASGAVPVAADLPGVRDWIESNVNGSRAVFVPRPEMRSIDEPTDAGRDKFISDLTYALRTLMTYFKSGNDVGYGAASHISADTASFSWDSVAERITKINL